MKKDTSELAGYVLERFERYKEGRKPFEERWEEAYYNTIGEYSPSVQGQWRGREATGSKLFVRLTRHKVRTASRHLEPALRQLRFDLRGEAGDERALSELKAEIERILSFARAADHLVDMAWEGAWSGTGILRVPVLAERAETVFEIDSATKLWTASAEKRPYPAVRNVPLWNFYPDPDSGNVEEGEGVIELHRLYPHQLRAMVGRAGWDFAAVEALVKEGDTSSEERWESSLRSAVGGSFGADSKKLRVLEYWGVVPASLLKKAGIELPEGAGEDVEALVIASNGRVLKCSPNPWVPAMRPYLRFRWEPVPHQFWGVGVAENIRDSQKMINGATRLLVDNKALAGNCMFEIDAEALVPGQDLSTVYPGKKWVLRPGAAGPAVRPVPVPDVSPVLIEMINLFTAFADETSGVAIGLDSADALGSQTATGLSIAQSAALEGYRSIIRRIDDEVIEPMIERIYRWLMEYGDTALPKAPARVRAVSQTATQAKELRSQRLMEFINLLGGGFGGLPANPSEETLAGKIDLGRVLEELADTLEVREIIKTKGGADGHR
ncbi:hypothetical protein EPN96_06695 [bacterium]|nr:MAG: hypothetical protein EPN96_06695 [bacterium]